MILKIENFIKEYLFKNGCFNINFEIEKFIVFGFLGLNGVGKSIFVKIFVGFLRFIRGKVFLFGKFFDDIVIKLKIGYFFENFKYFDWMIVYEVMEFYC